MQPLQVESPYKVDVLRLDLIDGEVSGNKWFKLKKNIDAASEKDKKLILSFGGPHSNHIAALAAACRKKGIPSVAVVRGEETFSNTPTLVKALADGMRLKFVSRVQYAQKDTLEFLDRLKSEFGDFYLVPEGGSNEEGLKGCAEIIPPGIEYDVVFCACGTATTFGGLMASAIGRYSVVGINVVKNDTTLPAKISGVLAKAFPEVSFPAIGNRLSPDETGYQYTIINDYAFSGFASFEEQWYEFKTDFEKQFNIPLDYIYTAKLFFAVFDLMQRRIFKTGSRILVVHSGGLQGNRAFEERYQLNARR